MEPSERITELESEVERLKATLKEKDAEIERLHKALGTFAITFKPDEHGLMQPVFDNGASTANMRVFFKLHEQNHAQAEVIGRMREAFEKIKNKENWGYFDDSGCAKGYGSYTESWVSESHPIEIAEQALTRLEAEGKEK